MFKFKKKFKNMKKFTTSVTPDSGIVCYDCLDHTPAYGSLNSLLTHSRQYQCANKTCKDNIFENSQHSSMTPLPNLTKCCGKKKLTSLKLPKNQRLCSGLARLSTFLAKTKNLQVAHAANPSKDLEHMCQQLTNLRVANSKLLPTHLWSQVSEHDSKILSCMILKRTEAIQMLENVKLASQYWQVEERTRRLLMNQQHKEYLKLLSDSRENHIRETKHRLRQLEMEQIRQKHLIAEEITEKDRRTDTMLKNIQLQKELSLCERRNREFHKHEAAIINQREKEIEKHNWRKSHLNDLKLRISRAAQFRDRLLNSYQQRLKSDNEMEKNIHLQNFEETIRYEEQKIEDLRCQLRERYAKVNEFVEARSRLVEVSQKQSQISAALRDMVKQPVTINNRQLILQVYGGDHSKRAG
jgi:hypothetical protein